MRSGPAELLQFGHVHGVLEDVGHGALIIEDRRVGRTPETILDLAVAVLGPGHPVADEREDVRFPGREDTLEGLPQQRRALVARIVGIVRKRVEDILADQLFKAREGYMSYSQAKFYETHWEKNLAPMGADFIVALWETYFAPPPPPLKP